MVHIPAESLFGKDLSGKNLSNARLYGANLRGFNFADANLSGADLRGADLYGAYLAGADLTGADLSGSDLRCANLYCAKLNCANLTGARLYLPYFEGAVLDGVIGFDFDHIPREDMGDLGHEIIANNTGVSVGCIIETWDFWTKGNAEKMGAKHKYSKEMIVRYWKEIERLRSKYAGRRNTSSGDSEIDDIVHIKERQASSFSDLLKALLWLESQHFPVYQRIFHHRSHDVFNYDGSLIESLAVLRISDSMLDKLIDEYLSAPKREHQQF